VSYELGKHQRRSIRLPSYDYSECGAYFATICAYERRCLFEDSMVKDALLWAWQSIPEHFDGVSLDEFVVMPNHIHGILWIRWKGGACPAPTLGTIVGSFKSAAAKRVNQTRGTQGKSVWQRNYFERVVRNEAELNAIRQYIMYNPVMWNEDCENPGFHPTALGGVADIADEVQGVIEGATLDADGCDRYNLRSSKAPCEHKRSQEISKGEGCGRG